MSFTRIAVLMTVLSLPMLALADEDSIKCLPSDDNSHAKCTVVPGKDGNFEFEFFHQARGNGHGTPTISAQIKLSGEACPPAEKGSGEDGIIEKTVTCTKSLKGGKIYNAEGIGDNTNAKGTRATLTAKRLGS